MYVSVPEINGKQDIFPGEERERYCGATAKIAMEIPDNFVELNGNLKFSRHGSNGSLARL